MQVQEPGRKMAASPQSWTDGAAAAAALRPAPSARRRCLSLENQCVLPPYSSRVPPAHLWLPCSSRTRTAASGNRWNSSQHVRHPHHPYVSQPVHSRTAAVVAGEAAQHCPAPKVLDEAGGNDYPASWLDVASEPLRYPGAAPVGKADPGSRLGSRTEPPGHAVDDPEGWTFPAPRQRAGLRPGWRPRGLPRPMYEAEGGKKAPDSLEVRRQKLDELRRTHKTNRKAVQKEVFPEGSRSSLPGSGEAAEAMPAAGMPGLPRPGGYQPSSLNEFHRTNSGTERSWWGP
ncbi:uncharacterized protein [Patagioenas fasciata]|uniref:uncharacterized protein n=1 Tax=Patagioenas fasciata TaxID=372321 RepID=UPI003A98D58A